MDWLQQTLPQLLGEDCQASPVATARHQRHAADTWAAEQGQSLPQLLQSYEDSCRAAQLRLEAAVERAAGQGQALVQACSSCAGTSCTLSARGWSYSADSELFGAGQGHGAFEAVQRQQGAKVQQQRQLAEVCQLQAASCRTCHGQQPQGCYAQVALAELEGTVQRFTDTFEEQQLQLSATQTRSTGLL